MMMDERQRHPRERRGALLRACPRCQGDLFRSEDLDGTEELYCLQCGRVFAPQMLAERRIA
jgi:uncharacterized protein YbaR (Trm112 family)